MSTEDNKATANRLWECWNQGNVVLLEELLTPNYVLHDPAGPSGAPAGGINSREDYKQYILSFRAGLQGEFTIDDMIAEGDKVVVRWTFRGTHQGQWRGVTPTSNAVTFTGTSTDRFVDGKLAETWSNVDNLGVLKQLGLYPA